MAKKPRYQQQLFAVIRFDEGVATPEHAFSVKEVTTDLALAEAEAERLNRLNEEKKSHYFVQSTRLFDPEANR